MPAQRPAGPPTAAPRLSRRSTLKLAAGALAAGPVAAACTPPNGSDMPDPLIALERSARLDTAIASTTAVVLQDRADALRIVAVERAAHAQALRAEVARARGVYRDGTIPDRDRDPSTSPPASPADSIRAVHDRISASRRAAVCAAASSTGYRAGLLGSIAAACAVETEMLLPCSSCVPWAPAYRQPPMESAASMGDTEANGLAMTLRTEYAAVFAYGLVGAHSRRERMDLIAEAVASHRAYRDRLVSILTAAHATVPQADAGYTTPFPVIDPASAARLAVVIENDTAVAWRAALEQSGSLRRRRSCVDGMTDCALRRAQWRAIAGMSPVTAAFPGAG